MATQYLYTVDYVEYPQESGRGWRPADWEERKQYVPEAIREAMENPDRFFIWPAVGKVYRSLSAAKKRKDLIESYGATAAIYRTPIVWELHETKDEKIARLEAALGGNEAA